MHAPWALAIGARLREKHGLDPQVMHADDGIVLRLPDADLLDFPSLDRPPADEAPVGADAALFDSGEIEQLVTDQVGGSALFASRFRECAGRALLLPRRSPGRRTPLWQQRQRASQLLEVASEYGSFPIVLEAVRECLQDVFDVPGLVELMGDLESRAVRLVEVTTAEPSPFARSLLFGYVAQFLYEGDSPLAERRAAALSLDSRLLSELLGQAELRELLDPQVLAELEAELQRLTPERRIKDAEGVADALRLLGPLTEAELSARGAEPLWALELEAARRAIRVRIGGEQRWAAIEDAGRLRDALGTPLPVGVPEAFTEPVKDPLGDLLARYARTHGPFIAAEAAGRFGLGTAVVVGTLHRLTAGGRLVQGEFRPVEGHTATVEWCDAEVLRRLRRRSLAALRQEVEPVPPRTLAAFLPQWQHLAGHRLRGVDGLYRVVEQLQGTALPASALEKLILPARLSDYSPEHLNELMVAGEIGWAGAGALPGKDGWISLHLAENAHLLRPEPVAPALTPVHTELLAALAGGYGLLYRQLADRLPDTADSALTEALWDLVWAGYVTNDSLAPLRALLGSGRTAGATAHRAPRATPRGRIGGAGRAYGARRPAPPTVAGRWSLLPEPAAEPTARAAAQAQTLLDRHGLLTRGTVAAERVPGGFAGVYRVLSAFEERGRARRGYFVEGLGGAQFAMDGAADRLRSVNGRLERAGAQGWAAGAPDGRGAEQPEALVLAAADPANAYGAALPWPEPPAAEDAKGTAHRPGRKAGALVVLVDGELVLYVERGGKSLLSWAGDAAVLEPAVRALAQAVRAGALGSVTVERANGEAALTSPLGQALEAVGFTPTPRGYRLRAS
ncbi:DEAD/DEAH box helicase [Kitasatospora paranensis]|uniref:Lhr family ATP-dependent helicase n=1 Tax=Kitasatospora paranensis TaxID=258053 RepID=UPI003623FF7B